MKKLIYLLVILITVYEVGFAQVTINNFHKYAVGDNVTTSNVDTTNLTEGQSGANRTWNFANINVLGESLTTQFIAVGGTPYASDFPEATICQKIVSTGTTIYSYNKQTSGEAYMLGQGYDENIIKYSNTQQVAKYPFTYGSTFTDTYYGQFTVGGFVNKKHGTVTYTADAYGSITLPKGTFQALRVKTETTTIDSLMMGTTPYVTRMTMVSYTWYTSQHKFPVFSIGTSELVSQWANIKTKNAEYTTDNISGIEQTSTTAPEGFKLKQNYPNPFNPSTTINYSLDTKGMVSLKIFDISGKEVKQLVNDFQSAGEYKVDFNASGLPSGTYFYKLEMDGVSEIKKMTLVK